MFVDDSCTFSHDFQGPQGTQNTWFGEHLGSESMPFFGHRFGVIKLRLWDPFWGAVWQPKSVKMTSDDPLHMIL